MSDYPPEAFGDESFIPPTGSTLAGGGWAKAAPQQAAWDPTTGELRHEPYPDQPPTVDPLAAGAEQAALPAVFAQQGARAVQLFRDPDAVQTLTHQATQGLLQRLEQLAADARTHRPEGRVTEAVLAPELTLMGDAHDTLDALARVFTAGKDRTRAIAGELVAEVADDPRRSTSVRVGDQHGTDLKVSRTQATDLRIDEDELLDVMVASLLGAKAAEPHGEVALTRDDTLRAYAQGARAALDLYRQLAASHTFKTTTLDAWGRELEGAAQDALAIRLGHAYGRVPKGAPVVKVERVHRSAGKAPKGGA